MKIFYVRILLLLSWKLAYNNITCKYWGGGVKCREADQIRVGKLKNWEKFKKGFLKGSFACTHVAVPATYTA